MEEERGEKGGAFHFAGWTGKERPGIRAFGGGMSAKDDVRGPRRKVGVCGESRLKESRDLQDRSQFCAPLHQGSRNAISRMDSHYCAIRAFYAASAASHH
jgi:hypothetical protein